MKIWPFRSLIGYATVEPTMINSRPVISATIFAVVLSIAASSFQANAFPKFARKEKKNCSYCHSVKMGGGPRGFRGRFYDAHKFSFNGFVEKVEAKKAGVKVNAMGPDSKPTKPYSGK
jgi:hypothetical protein